MSGREGDLSDKQRTVLNQLRQNLRDITLPDDSDYYLLRWLRARSFDLKKSEKMLRDHLKWRADNDIDNILDWEIPEVLVKYFPGGYFGEDKKGRPIWYDTSSLVDVKGIALSTKREDFIRLKIYWAEYVFKRSFPELSKKHGKRVDECSVILDLKGFSTRFFWKPIADVMIEVLKQLEANYPETLGTAYVINAPKIFPIAFNLIKPFLSEYTKEKIRICGSDWKQYLQLDIDPAYIPVYWGGTARDPDGDEYCRSQICMGGDVPESYYLLRSFKEQANMEEYEHVTIKASSSVKVKETVDRAGCILRWNFWTEGKDIAFGILYMDGEGGRAEEVEKVRRVNSHLVPEHGTHRCQQPGTYIVQFDNKYSWMNAKKLSYQIEVLVPDDEEDLPQTVSVTTHL